jgi:hypothetical protein
MLATPVCEGEKINAFLPQFLASPLTFVFVISLFQMLVEVSHLFNIILVAVIRSTI